MPFIHESTWSSISAKQGEGEVHARYEKAVDELTRVLSGSPKVHPNFIGGKERPAGTHFDVTSPIDSRIIIGRFPKGTSTDASDAMDAAALAFKNWKMTDLSERLRIVRRAADIIRHEKFELAALLTMSNGKVRREAVGEVDMAIDHLEYYTNEMERNHGYNREGAGPSPHERASNVFLPYGPWAVICPFNFPFGISMGMLAGVLITGNTAVIKPSSPSPAPVYAIYDAFSRAGIPPGTLNLVAGSGVEVGEALVKHPKVEGIVFTGSKEIGYSILHHNVGRRYPIPIILELGGKNAAIISSKADVARAVKGVASSAFGYSGQKCVACSRVYVHESVAEEFLDLLVKEAEGFKVSDPRSKEARTGPVIHEMAVKNYDKAVSAAKRDGRILTGGRRLIEDGLGKGCFVSPTVVTGLTDGHELVRNELFLPFLCVMSYSDLEDALSRANGVDYGLTAGIYTQDQAEVDHFLENIQAGMVYVNGVRGATNGAITGIHSFGGWKGSGSTGRGSGDIHYLPQFMRQQGRALAK
jgi:1-pyrroline-5-carboxylate dehydrogenase